MITKLSIGPGAGEVSSLDTDVLDEAISVVSKLFRQHRFCFPIGYNLQRVSIQQRAEDGMASHGFMTWAIKVQPFEANYTKTAYVNVDWDTDKIRIPAIFVDHQGNSRGFSEVSVRRFLYAGADLSEYEAPRMPIV